MESYKSGFEPPGDVEFEDYGQAMKRTASETSLSNTRDGKEKPTTKSKGKLWPFIKNKNKVTHEYSHRAPVTHKRSLLFVEVTFHCGEIFVGWVGGLEGYLSGYGGSVCVIQWLSEIYVFNVTFVVSVSFVALAICLI